MSVDPCSSIQWDPYSSEKVSYFLGVLSGLQNWRRSLPPEREMSDVCWIKVYAVMDKKVPKSKRQTWIKIFCVNSSLALLGDEAFLLVIFDRYPSIYVYQMRSNVSLFAFFFRYMRWRCPTSKRWHLSWKHASSNIFSSLLPNVR